MAHAEIWYRILAFHWTHGTGDPIAHGIHAEHVRRRCAIRGGSHPIVLTLQRLLPRTTGVTVTCFDLFRTAVREGRPFISNFARCHLRGLSLHFDLSLLFLTIPCFRSYNSSVLVFLLGPSLPCTIEGGVRGAAQPMFYEHGQKNVISRDVYHGPGSTEPMPFMLRNGVASSRIRYLVPCFICHLPLDLPV